MMLPLLFAPIVAVIYDVIPKGANGGEWKRSRRNKNQRMRTVVQAWTKNLPTGVRLYMV